MRARHLTWILFAIPVFVASIDAQEAPHKDKLRVPNDLEIVIIADTGGQFGRSSITTIRDNRTVEIATADRGLPNIGRCDLQRLLLLNPRADEQKTKENYRECISRSRARNRAPSWRYNRMSKDSRREILGELLRIGFFDMDPELMCRNKKREKAFFVNHQGTLGLQVRYNGTVFKQTVDEGCGLISGEPIVQRQRFLALHDFIMERLGGVRRIRVAYEPVAVSRLRYLLRNKRLPKGFEITAEKSDSGVQHRIRINSLRRVFEATRIYGTVVKIEGRLIGTQRDDPKDSEKAAVKATHQVVSENSIRNVLLRILKTDFLKLNPVYRSRISGPPRFRSLTVRIEESTYRVQMPLYGPADQDAATRFGDVFKAVNLAVNDVTKLEEPW